MGFFDNLLGSDVDPRQMQMAQMLGLDIDPKDLQRRARQRSLADMGAAMAQSSGRGGILSALGGALQSTRGSGDRLLNDEISRTMQFRQFQEQQGQLKQRALMQQQIKQLLPQALKGMPPEMAQMIALQASSGDTTLMNKALEQLMKPPTAGKTLYERAAAGDQNAVQALKLQQADALARAQGGAPVVNVGSPDLGALMTAASKAFGKGGGEAFSANVDEANKRAEGLSRYAANVRAFNDIAGEDQVVGGSLGVQAKEFLTGVGLGGAVDQEKLARQRAAVNLSSKSGIEELANLSGPDTDKDFERVMQAGPMLQQTPKGRALFAEITQAKARQAQQIARYANEQSRAVEEGKITVEQARENVRRKNEQTLVTPAFDKRLEALGFGGGGSAAPAASGDGWSAEVIGG